MDDQGSSVSAMGDEPLRKKVRVKGSDDSTLSSSCPGDLVEQLPAAAVTPSSDSNSACSKGKWVVYDLDGAQWFTRDKDHLNTILCHSNLFRLLSRKRIDTFLRDLRLDIPYWRTQLSLFKNFSSRLNSEGGEHFTSLNKVRNCEDLIVWNDLRLFESFLKCKFDAKDLNELSLGKFLPVGDAAVVWTCDATLYGRSKLCTALVGLELMCYVNFDECFLGVFDSLRKFIENTPELENFHDIFIKFRLEFVLQAFFNDVSSLKSSFCHPHMPMVTPVDCCALLVAYINGFMVSLLLEESLPHFRFYGSAGEFKEIKLDSLTTKALMHGPSYGSSVVGMSRQSLPTPSPLLVDSSSGSSVPSRPPSLPASVPPSVYSAGPPLVSSRGKTRTTSLKGSHSGGRLVSNSQKSHICIWWLAQECRGVMNGKKVSCTDKRHTSVNHPPIGSVRFIDAIDAVVNMVNWRDETKRAFKDIFHAQRDKFSSA